MIKNLELLDISFGYGYAICRLIATVGISNVIVPLFALRKRKECREHDRMIKNATCKCAGILKCIETTFHSCEVTIVHHLTLYPRTTYFGRKTSLFTSPRVVKYRTWLNIRYMGHYTTWPIQLLFCYCLFIYSCVWKVILISVYRLIRNCDVFKSDRKKIW